MKFTGKTYDALKFIALVLLPAVAAAYFSLSNVLSLPYADEVVGTITVLDTFLGVVLGISNSQYNKATEAAANVIDGDLLVSEVDGEKYLSLGIAGQSVEELTAKGEVRLRVTPHAVSGE